MLIDTLLPALSVRENLNWDEGRLNRESVTIFSNGSLACCEKAPGLSLEHFLKKATRTHGAFLCYSDSLKE